MKHVHIQDPNTIRTEADALDQSIALNRIVMAMLQHQKKVFKYVFIALIISLLANLFIVGGFLYYNSLYDYTTTTTTTETVTTTTDIQQEVSGENSNINNVQGDQYNDNATHNEGASD